MCGGVEEEGVDDGAVPDATTVARDACVAAETATCAVSCAEEHPPLILTPVMPSDDPTDENEAFICDGKAGEVGKEDED